MIRLPLWLTSLATFFWHTMDYSLVFMPKTFGCVTFCKNQIKYTYKNVKLLI